LQYLRTGELTDKFLTQYSPEKPTCETLWRRHKAAILAEHIKASPCTRPPGWWLYDSPEEDRLIVGGSGSGECGPTPPGWRVWENIQHFERIDPANPPIVESEAAFLNRHGFLTDAEISYLNDHPELLRPIAIMPFDTGDNYDWAKGQ
jgi:hypothetical protein